MITDVELSIEGDHILFPEKAVNGVTFAYSFNAIPIAKLELDMPYLVENGFCDFLTNPAMAKNRDLGTTIIKIKSKTGCIAFEGYFDGLEVNQSVASIHYSAIFKSKFQVLLETFPRFMGLVPQSYKVYKVRDHLEIVTDNPDLAYVKVVVGLEEIHTNGSFAEFFMTLLTKLVDSQTAVQLDNNTAQDFFPGMQDLPISNLLKDEKYQASLVRAEKLLQQIDTTSVSNAKIVGSASANDLITRLYQEQTNVWEQMLSVLDYFRCAVIVGTNKMFVVPKANFLNGAKASVPELQQTSDENCVAFPAEYNNLSINDIGYVNLRSCYIMPMAEKGISDMLQNGPTSMYQGIYPSEGKDTLPDDGSTGILVEAAEPFYNNNLLLGMYTQGETLTDLSTPQCPYSGDVVDDEKAAAQEISDTIDSIQKKQTEQRDILDQFAKLTFLEAKNAGRSGSFTTIFNPTWVPGTTGVLYVRLPGIFYNFYITGVTHTFSLSAPTGGTALTNVVFDAVRSAKDAGSMPGVDTIELFKYDLSKMQEIQDKWIADVQAVEQPPTTGLTGVDSGQANDNVGNIA